MNDLHLEEFLCSTAMALIIGVIVVVAFIVWYMHGKGVEAGEREKRLERPKTRITDWQAGWRCPTCGHWTQWHRQYLGAVVCEQCGSPAHEYEQVKYRWIQELDDDGRYKKKRPIDMSAVVMQFGECDYCGKKPCGCGATHNWLDVFEEVEA